MKLISNSCKLHAAKRDSSYPPREEEHISVTEETLQLRERELFLVSK